MMVDPIRLTAALARLAPGAQWRLGGPALGDLAWLEPAWGAPRPTDAEILAAMEREGAAPPVVALTPAQAHAGLADRGLLTPFYAWLDTLPFATRKAFEFADRHERDNSILTAALAAPAVGGMSAASIDLFFAAYGGVAAPPAAVVPADPGVHMAWLELALIEIGKLEAVEAAVAQSPSTASLWRRATTLRKSDPEVVAIAAALGIDRDALFARADAIRRMRVSP